MAAKKMKMKKNMAQETGYEKNPGIKKASRKKTKMSNVADCKERGGSKDCNG